MQEKGLRIVIKCSDCRAPLAEVWTSEEDSGVTTKIIVHCPHCGEHSFITEIKEKCFLGGTDFTSIDKFDIETSKDGTITQNVFTSKVKDYG